MSPHGMSGLVNPDMYQTASGVSIANTYILLGDDRAIFSVVNRGTPRTYSAFSTMQIYRDHAAWAANLQPVEVRAVTYPVPDPSAVYDLLYHSAKQSEGWANATAVSAAGTPAGNATPAGDT